MSTSFNDRAALDRLIHEYQEHNNLIIGFDFDNTVFDCHLKGLDCSEVIRLLRKCSARGFTMCLWTITSDGPTDSIALTLEQKVEVCKTLGIAVDYINSSPIKLGKEDERKQFFSILLDDRAGLESAVTVLSNTLKWIEKSEQIDE